MKYTLKIAHDFNSAQKLADEGYRVVGIMGEKFVMEKPVKYEQASDEYTEEFKKAWDAFGRVGNKFKAWKSWKRLNIEEKSMIRVHLPKYVSTTAPMSDKKSDLQFRMHFSTYLNNKHWESELSKEIKDNIANVMQSKGQANPDYYNSKEYFEDLKNIRR